MQFEAWIPMNIYSLAVTLFVIVSSFLESDSKSKQNKIFIADSLLVFALVIFNSISNMAFTSGGLFIMIKAANIICYLLLPLIEAGWCGYAISNIYIKAKKKVMPFVFILGSLILGDIVLVAINPFLKLFYYYDNGGVFLKGKYYYVNSVILIAVFIVSEIMIGVCHNYIEKNYMAALVSFPLMPIAGLIVELFTTGVPFYLGGLSFALLIIFVYIQHHSINIDYLTGAFNRRKLDKEIEDRINKAVKPKNFSAILVDIDHFKSINDTCGYNGGDRALEDTAHLLQDVSNANDIVARYDVDEFCILTDTSDIKKLEALAERVRAAARSFNDSGKRPYKLFYSIGYAIYDQSSKMNLQQYIKLLDRNLSDDKRNNRQAEETADMDSLF